MRSEHEAAVRYFSKAYDIDPTFHRVRLERGVLLYRELNRYVEALADFNFLLDEKSDYSNQALLNRALLYQQQAMFEKSLTDLNSFLDFPPDEYYQEAFRMRELLQAMISDEASPEK